MQTYFSIARQIVGLDWRLLVSACRGCGPDLMLPAVLGALVLVAFCESAVTTASVLAGRPATAVAPVLAAFVWNAVLAAAALTIAAGGRSNAERIVRYLAPEPITRPQIYATIVALSLAGRHALVSGIVLVPLVCLLTGLGDLPRAAVGSLALLFVLRLVPGVTRCTALLAIPPTGLRTALLLVGVAVLTMLAVPRFSVLVAMLPPSLVVQYVLGLRTSQSLWLLLDTWTMAIGLVEYVTLFHRPVAIERTHAAAALPTIPRWIRSVAWMAGIHAPLLHGELLRLIRWRRFLIGWVVYAAALALVLTRMPTLDTRVLPILLVALAPPFVVTATLGNLFGPDRAGVQAFYLTLEEPHSAINAKIVAVGIFVVVAEIISMCLVLAFVSKRWQLGDLYAPIMALVLYLYIASAGRITSTLFPVSNEPRAIAGGLLRGPGAALSLTLNGLALVGIVAPALSHDTRGISSIGLAVAGVAISTLVAVALGLSSTLSKRTMSNRREELIASLSQDSWLS